MKKTPQRISFFDFSNASDSCSYGRTRPSITEKSL